MKVGPLFCLLLVATFWPAQIKPNPPPAFQARGSDADGVTTRGIVDFERPADAVQLVGTTDRDAVGHFLRLADMIDVTIPRGGKSLIDRVSANGERVHRSRCAAC